MRDEVVLSQFVARGLACAGRTVVLAALPLCALLIAVRRGAPLQPAKIGVLTGWLREWRTSRSLGAVSLVGLAALMAASPAWGADHLSLAPGLSFTDDSSAGFPIQGDHLGDAESPPGRATVIFFGAAHCWNTNREAERLVTLYPKYRDRVSFIVVDVNHPSPAQRALLASDYRGAIPTLVVRAPNGRVVYSQAGETAPTRGDTQPLDSLIAKALDQ
jgi:hypothetical protein